MVNTVTTTASSTPAYKGRSHQRTPTRHVIASTVQLTLIAPAITLPPFSTMSSVGSQMSRQHGGADALGTKRSMDASEASQRIRVAVRGCVDATAAAAAQTRCLPLTHLAREDMRVTCVALTHAQRRQQHLWQRRWHGHSRICRIYLKPRQRGICVVIDDTHVTQPARAPAFDSGAATMQSTLHHTQSPHACNHCPGWLCSLIATVQQ